MIAQKMGFDSCYPVSGQTYSRKVDTRVMNVVAGIAASAHKMSNDIRLLQHLKEVEEPFEKSQIGSRSAILTPIHNPHIGLSKLQLFTMRSNES
jgi:adenylosuccinate lyase